MAFASSSNRQQRAPQDPDIINSTITSSVVEFPFGGLIFIVSFAVVKRLGVGIVQNGLDAEQVLCPHAHIDTHM
jgi:hypothetical protein